MVSITLPDGTVVNIGDWTDQVYSMEDLDGTQYHWSVSQALEKAKACGDIRIISLKEMGVTVERVRKQYDDMDELYAMTTDLTRPLLFVPMRDEVQLIEIGRASCRER